MSHAHRSPTVVVVKEGGGSLPAVSSGLPSSRHQSLTSTDRSQTSGLPQLTTPMDGSSVVQDAFGDISGMMTRPGSTSVSGPSQSSPGVDGDEDKPLTNIRRTGGNKRNPSNSNASLPPIGGSSTNNGASRKKHPSLGTFPTLNRSSSYQQPGSSSQQPPPSIMNTTGSKNMQTDRSKSAMLMRSGERGGEGGSRGAPLPPRAKSSLAEDEYDELDNTIKKVKKSELEVRMERNSLTAVYNNHINWCKKQATSLQRQKGPDGKFASHTTKAIEPVLGSKRGSSSHITSFTSNNNNNDETWRGQSSFLDAVFEERFDGRLQHVHDRNKDDWIEEVQDRKMSQMQEQLSTREETFQRREDRRNRIYDEIASAAERRRLEELGAWGARWTHMTCIVMLFVKWKQALHTQEAFEVYRRLLLPMLQLRMYSKRKAAARRERIAANLPKNPRPGPEALTRSKEGFFSGWNIQEIELFLSFVKPTSFLAGDHIMHAGDYDRVMYIIMTGTVEIQIKKKGKDKRRCRENSTCFPLATPTYVGEFALLCREPRSASIQCITDVDGWYIEYNDFEKVLTSLRPEQFDQLEQATNARRTQNLINYFPTLPDALRRYSAFVLMPQEMLRAVNASLIPHVLQQGHVLFNEGDYDPRFYIISDGELSITTPRSDPSAPPVMVGVGEAMGMFETFFLHESRKYTATVSRNCEMWSLSREAINDIGNDYPGVLQQCRTNIKDRLAERLANDATSYAAQLAQAAAAAASAALQPGRVSHRQPSLFVDSGSINPTPFSHYHQVVPVPKVLTSDPFLRHCFSHNALHIGWHQVAAPVILASGDTLLERGKPVHDIYVLVSGRFRIDYPAINGMARYNDDVVVDPLLRGAYSLRPPPVQNLATMFPLTPIVGVPEWRRGNNSYATDGNAGATSAAEAAAKRDQSRMAFANVVHLETEGGEEDPEGKGKGKGPTLRSLIKGNDGDYGGLYGTTNKVEAIRQMMITPKAAILFGSNELCVNGGISQKTVMCSSMCIGWRINVEKWLGLTEQHLNALRDSKCQTYLAANTDGNIRTVLLNDPPYVKVHKAHLQNVAEKEKLAVEAAQAAHLQSVQQSMEHQAQQQGSGGGMLGAPGSVSGKRSQRSRSAKQQNGSIMGFSRSKSGLSSGGQSSFDPTPTNSHRASMKSIPISLALGGPSLQSQRSMGGSEFGDSVSPAPPRVP